MPFTPFHFGPALLLKASVPKHVSLSAFVATQVVIDVETLTFILLKEWPLHRLLHSFLFASLVGLATGLASWAAVTYWRRRARAPAPALEGELRLVPSLLGGLIGGASHPLLDGIMHADVQPFRPFSDANPFLHAVDLTSLHVLCFGAGGLGLLLVFLRFDQWRKQP